MMSAATGMVEPRLLSEARSMYVYRRHVDDAPKNRLYCVYSVKKFNVHPGGRSWLDPKSASRGDPRLVATRSALDRSLFSTLMPRVAARSTISAAPHDGRYDRRRGGG